MVHHAYTCWLSVFRLLLLLLLFDARSCVFYVIRDSVSLGNRVRHPKDEPNGRGGGLWYWRMGRGHICFGIECDYTQHQTNQGDIHTTRHTIDINFVEACQKCQREEETQTHQPRLMNGRTIDSVNEPRVVLSKHNWAGVAPMTKRWDGIWRKYHYIVGKH